MQSVLSASLWRKRTPSPPCRPWLVRRVIIILISLPVTAAVFADRLAQLTSTSREAERAAIMQALGLDVPAPVRAGQGRGPLRDSGAQMRTVLCARSVLGVVGYICRRPALKTITAPHAGRDSGAAHDVVQRGSRHARRAIRAALCPSNGLPSPGRRRRRIRRLDSTGIGVGKIDDPGPGRSIALERSQGPRPPSQAHCECSRGATGSRPNCVPTVRKLSGALPGTARPGFKESSRLPSSARPDKTLRQKAIARALRTQHDGLPSC